MKFFKNKSSKKEDDDNELPPHGPILEPPPQQHPPSSGSATSTPQEKSPTKASASRSPSKKAAAAAAPRPESPSSREAKSSQPRPPRTFTRHATDPGSSRKAKKIDPDTHPLNLPPEQRKRLSALSAMSDRNSMDVDKEPVNGGIPSSPPPHPQPAQAAAQKAHHHAKPSAPAHSSSFTVPVTNGQNNAATNGAGDERVPTPPPHRSQPSSPVQSAIEEAEALKNEGNKLFKNKDYARAIEFYTKGELQIPFFSHPFIREEPLAYAIHQR
jgi:DnaJ homolog subfamily C member 7